MPSVIVIGAGLSGLRCAQILIGHGYDVTVLEASDRPGGRVKSDLIDGFICDHGFQVINPRYSELIATGIVPELHIRPLPQGFDINIDGKEFRLGDFRKNLGYFSGDLSRATGSVREKLNFLRFVALPGSDKALGDALRGSGSFYKDVLKRFLDGVFLSNSDEVSSQMARELIYWFIKGSPGVPETGVQALPQALMKKIKVHFDTEVLSVQDGVVRTDDQELRADYVVVATNAIARKRLVGGDEIAMNYSATWYHAVPAGALTSDHLRVATEPPLINSVVISNVASSYAPTGKSLISSTTLQEISATEAEKAVSKFWNISQGDMELVSRYEIPDSLPRHLPGKGLTRSRRLSEKIFIAGDDRSIPAQQGALESGRLVAEAIIADR